MEDSRIIVFGLSSSNELTDEICSHLNVERGKVKINHFADGEVIVEPEETVRGRHVFLVQSTCGPVNDNLMELLVAIDACKRASAKEITCIIPYYGYARQERKSKPRQPITARLVADMLDVAGADRVVAVDLHAAAIQGFFKKPTDDLSAVSLFGNYFRTKNIPDLVVVSPDHGGATRARKLSGYLNDAPVAIVDKRRFKPNEAEALNVIGDVKDKNVVLIDDICDTAGSLVGAAKMLKEKGAKDVYFCCTHAIFSRNAVERIQNSCIKEAVITNTIPLPEEKKDPKIKVLSVGDLLAETIKAIYECSPVSTIVDKFA